MMKRTTLLNAMHVFCIALIVGLTSHSFSQVSGIKNIPADYPTIAAFVTDINTNGIGAGGVTLNIPSGYSETTPAGGFTITATGTAANPIVIQGTGGAPKPIITASGAQVAGNLNDGIIKLIGTDYITISGLDLRENSGNTTTAGATNNMTEWGVVLLYASTTDGCTNVSILNNNFSMGSTYQNAFGIYANSTHTATAVTTNATATTGNNNNLVIKGNVITNVNLGIVVVGPTGAADHADGLVIGGASGEGNLISYGLNATFSGYVNVSGSVNGILIRNTKNINCSFNSLISSGTVTAGTLNGIQIQAFSSTPTGNFTQNINNNIISIRSNVVAGAVNGITQPSGSASTTSVCNINDNTFTAFGHTIASASGTLTMINTASTHFTTNINGNMFNNLSVNTTGSVTFISHSYTMPANGTKSVSNNAILTSFSKTGAGGTVTFSTTGASSPNSASGVYSNNTVTNITLTGATAFVGFTDSDGSSSGANKQFNNNSIASVTTGAAAITGITCTYWGGTTSSASMNNILNLNGQGSINGINLGSTYNGATNLTVQGNNIAGLVSSGTGGSVTAISCSNTSPGILITQNVIGTLTSSGASTINGIAFTGTTTATISRNSICSLLGTNASSLINGILVSAASTVDVQNNIIGNLSTTVANAANAVNGISITGGTTVNVFYNTVNVSGTSSGALFGSSALSVSSTPTVAVRNNILINTGVPTGAGLCVAYRRSSTTLTTYDNTSNNNDLVGTAIYTDGTNTDVTLAAFQTRVTPRDGASLTITPAFLSTACGNSNYLRIDPTVITGLESGATNIAGITADIDGGIRAGNAGYAGTGTNPDIGADEFETTIPTCSTVDAGSITTSTVHLCTSAPTTTMTSSGFTIASGITFQWKVSNTAGGPYTNVIGGSGATTNSYTTPALIAGTYYFVLEATCSAGPITDLSNEVTVNVTANPTVSISPSSATYCSPTGTAVALTASGASTYAWSPATGLSATTGMTVNASPSATQTYTVTGTDAVGCTGTGTTTITVNPAVISTAAIATPPAVCSGGNSQLQATGYYAGLVSTYGYAAGTGTSLQDMTGALTVIGTGVDDAPMGTPGSIGFNFVYNGVAYSQYSISPDGWILLGGATAASQFTNAVTSTTNIPKIYPFWDDLATGTDGNVKVLVTGTAPNRIMVVQWFVTIPRNTTGAANSTFQAWLYEVDGKIEFRYGTMGVPSTGTISGGLTAGATNYQSLSYAGNTVSNATPNDANAIAPAAGTIYTFTLPQATTYVWTPATFLNNAAISNPMASGITATTTYTVTASQGGCNASNSVTVSAGSPLTSTAVAAPGTSVCAGTSVTITGSGVGGGAPYTYAWTGPNGFTSTSASFNIASITATEAGTYTVVVTDNCGANSTSSVTMTVNALPIVTVSPTSAVYCAPGTGVTVTANGASTYVWTPASGLSSTTGATVIATPSANTTYTVTGTDVNGCLASATTTINNAPAVSSVSVTATPATVCNGGSSNLVAAATLATFTYCTSTHSSGCSGDNMAVVQLGTINNNTGTNCGGTSHFTYFTPSATTTTNLSVLTASNSLSVTFGTDANQYFGAWIDYNRNGSFEASEFLGASGNAGSSGTIAITFAVPAGAYNGLTRMRIVGGNDSPVTATQACGASSSAWGETQDYDVTITDGVELFTYNWTPVANLSASTGAAVSATNLTSSVTYTATASTLQGCSKTGNVSITVNPTSTSTTTITACGAYTWTNGTGYTVSGTYTQTLTNVYGCDSVATLNLTILQPGASHTYLTACASYTWASNSTTYTTSGTYMNTITAGSANGCDSIAFLHLTINQPSTATQTISACSAYTWPVNGTNYTASGIYTHTLVGANAVNCDSTITLNLTINQPTTATQTISSCGAYTWPVNNTNYTTSGTYTHTLTAGNANGCDSTITLNLTINQPSTATQTVSACGSYTWSVNGTNYTTSGTFTHTLTNANAVGCDSTITLNLTINQPATATQAASACGSYTWSEDNNTYTTSGTYTHTITAGAANGCDSIITLNLTINQPATGTDVQTACGSFTWIDGNTYTASNSTATHIIPGGAANGCDSIVTLNLTINALPTPVVTNNGDGTMTSTSGITYQWINCTTNQPIAGANSANFAPTANGSYAVITSNAAGCSDTSACVTMSNLSVKENTGFTLAVNPNPTTGLVKVVFNSDEKATVQVMDASGKVIQTNVISSNDTIDLTSVERGVYFLKIESGSNAELIRIVKQ